MEFDPERLRFLDAPPTETDSIPEDKPGAVIAAFQDEHFRILLEVFFHTAGEILTRHPQDHVRCISDAAISPNVVKVRLRAFLDCRRELPQLREKKNADVEALCQFLRRVNKRTLRLAPKGGFSRCSSAPRTPLSPSSEGVAGELLRESRFYR